MNSALRFIILLFFLSTEVDALVYQQQVEQPRSIERHIQREENESDAATTDFLTPMTRAVDDPAVNFSTLAAFVDILVSTASSSMALPLDSNWTSMIDQSDDDNQVTSTDEDTFDSIFTPSPELSSSSESEETNASLSIDQVVGSTFSASGDLEHTVGDANTTDGANVPNNLATMQLPSGIAMSMFALHVFVLIF
ncbi:Hypothetical protein PHPALM_16231 [Phytophthora palmivora]|uniref:Uncharacterized protein n=1 Tax=Phytophthora palmivora TaxID=4796 RepID=A0A2P4XQ79_9STRA|nr:Hypothetical protein PHPALM_16231 [Phytophthora palmivora]